MSTEALSNKFPEKNEFRKKNEKNECEGCGNLFDTPHLGSSGALCAPCVAVSQRVPLDPAEQFCYMWQHKLLGGFRQRLAELIAHADDANQSRLRLSFPDEVFAIDSWQHVSGFASAIREKGWEC